MKKVISIAFVTVLFGALAMPAVAGTKTVSWGFSSPHSITVSKGTKVTWSWSSGGHNVVGPGLSTAVKARGSASRTFTSKGSFRYHCAPHAAAMYITVNVR